MTAYPKRPPFFAARFCRAMTKVCLANELGGDVCWMLSVIAHQEDASHYRRAVTFHNSQLMSVCGYSEKQLARARDRAVEAGWLHYRPGAKGVVPRYFVTIPPYASGLDDLPTDEGQPTDSLSLRPQSTTKTAPESGENRESMRGRIGSQCGGESGENRESIGGAFIPSPNPGPSPDPNTLTPDPLEPDDPARVCDPTPYPSVPADGTDEPFPAARERRQQPDPSLATAPADFDPLRHGQQAAKEFLTAWTAAGLLPREFLTPTEQDRLVKLLGVEWWAAGWREGLTKAGRNPFFRDGVGRYGNRLTPGQFLRSEQTLRDILDAGDAAPSRPRSAIDRVAEIKARMAASSPPTDGHR